MILHMPRPHKHPKTGVYYFRQKTPADLRQIFGKAEISWSLRTKDEEVAKIRNAEAVHKQALVWQSLRASPSALPHKQILSIVGQYRRDLDAMLEVEPGEVGIWDGVLRLEAGYAADPDGLERWGGTEADRLLRENGLAADIYSRTRLLDAMHKARMEWATFQHRRAEGDYSPDPSAQRFPEWNSTGPKKAEQTAAA